MVRPRCSQVPESRGVHPPNRGGDSGEEMGNGVSSDVEGCGVTFPVPHNENIKNESIVNKFSSPHRRTLIDTTEQVAIDTQFFFTCNDSALDFFSLAMIVHLTPNFFSLAMIVHLQR